MSRYPEVASTIECSAKLNFGVLDVFVSAQKVSDFLVFIPMGIDYTV